MHLWILCNYQNHNYLSKQHSLDCFCNKEAVCFLQAVYINQTKFMLQRKMTEAAGFSKMLIPSIKLYESYPRRQYKGHALAQAVNQRPLNLDSQVDATPVHVGFVVSETANVLSTNFSLPPQNHSISAPNPYFIHL